MLLTAVKRLGLFLSDCSTVVIIGVTIT